MVNASGTIDMEGIGGFLVEIPDIFPPTLYDSISPILVQPPRQAFGTKTEGRFDSYVPAMNQYISAQ